MSFLRDMDFEQDQLIENQGAIFLVRPLKAVYLLPARFNDMLMVHTQVEKSRHASLIFSQKITDLKQNKELFEAQVSVACLDAQKFKPRAIPSGTLEKINGQ